MCLHCNNQGSKLGAVYQKWWDHMDIISQLSTLLAAGGEEEVAVSQPVCCLPQWTQPRSTDTHTQARKGDRAVKKKSNPGLLQRLTAGSQPGPRWREGEPQSCCLSRSGESWAPELFFHRTTRGKVERTTCTLHPLFSVSVCGGGFCFTSPLLKRLTKCSQLAILSAREQRKTSEKTAKCDSGNHLGKAV